jgi:hypothetical protein
VGYGTEKGLRVHACGFPIPERVSVIPRLADSQPVCESICSSVAYHLSQSAGPSRSTLTGLGGIDRPAAPGTATRGLPNERMACIACEPNLVRDWCPGCAWMRPTPPVAAQRV